MKHNATITVSQLKTILDQFSGEVYQHKAPKMNYESWRRLKGITEKLGTIIPITFSYKEKNCDNYNNYLVDCSKGGLGTYAVTVPDEFIYLLQKAEANSSTKMKKVDDKNVDGSSMTNSAWISNNCDNTISSTLNGVLNQYITNTPNKLDNWAITGTGTGTSVAYPSYPCACNSSITIQKEEKEKTMNIPTMKFDFGPADSNSVAMSPYGLAIQYNGSWYAYNAKEDQTIDVTGMTFSFKNAIYKMPVAVNQIAVGDLIYHQKRPMYVIAAPEGASIKVIDLAASEQKTVIPVANMFGFNYVTKIAPLFNLGTITPSTDNPFGNIMPMMMMSSLFEDNKSDNDVMQMMLMMSLMNGNNPFAAMFAGGGSNAQ
jgi:hypothetical protein